MSEMRRFCILVVDVFPSLFIFSFKFHCHSFFFVSPQVFMVKDCWHLVFIFFGLNSILSRSWCWQSPYQLRAKDIAFRKYKHHKGSKYFLTAAPCAESSRCGTRDVGVAQSITQRFSDSRSQALKNSEWKRKCKLWRQAINPKPQTSKTMVTPSLQVCIVLIFF